MTGIFLVTTQKFFCFFFNRKSIFVRKQTFFDSQIQVVFYALYIQDRPTFGVLINQGLCHLCSVATTTENFSETKFRKKKSKFLIYGKTPIIQFLYMEKCLS